MEGWCSGFILEQLNMIYSPSFIDLFIQQMIIDCLLQCYTMWNRQRLINNNDGWHLWSRSCEPTLNASCALSHSKFLVMQLLLVLPINREGNCASKSLQSKPEIVGVRYGNWTRIFRSSPCQEVANVLSSRRVHVDRGKRIFMQTRIVHG